MNQDWLKVFAVDRRRKLKDWIPLAKLLSDDALFDGADTRDIAYAESWTVVYTLLTTEEMLPRVRRYLDAIRHRATLRSDSRMPGLA